MEKDENKTRLERKSEISLKEPVISLVIVLILAASAFLCSKINNDILNILMAIISAIVLLCTVILIAFSDVALPNFTAFLEEKHLSLSNEKIQINSCEDLWQYAKKSAKASKTGTVKWLWLVYKEYHKQKKVR